ncbi:MAG: PKD domain-containing protein, partial [Candidatus Aminicenantales bacterium]
PGEDYITKPFTFDASGSTDEDGQVVKATFEMTDETGNVVDSFMTQKPFTWEKVFERPGVYTITVVVEDDFGAMSNPCRAEVTVNEKRLYGMFDAAPLYARGSYGPYLTGRLGIGYMIVPGKVSFTVAGGGAVALKGDPWKSFFLATAMLNVHAKAAYFGAGLGFNTQVREDRDQSDPFLVGNVGFIVFNNYTSIGSIFFEGQGPVGEGRSFADHHKFSFGFRLLF